MIDNTIEPRGFEPIATAIVLRTVATCYQMCHQPDDRALIGVGLFTVTPHEDGYRFASHAQVLRDGDIPALLDWLELRIPQSGVIISWDSWWPVTRRLAALIDPALHPRTVAAIADPDGRWRDLPRSMTWHMKQAPVTAMPCLCGPAPHPQCVPELPAALLPDPAEAKRTMMREAARAWACWANSFGDFDDHEHPARRALAAVREHAAGARQAD